MLERARDAVSAAGHASTVQLLQSRADRLPLANGSFDVAVVNGIFNLNPTRAEILKELHRVLRRGGGLYVAEIVRLEPAPAVEPDVDNWVA